MSPRSAAFKSYLRYLNPDLPGSEQDRYYSEIALVAERLGARAVPRDRQQIAAYLEAMRPRLRCDERTREVVRILFNAPAPSTLARPFGALMLRAGAGCCRNGPDRCSTSRSVRCNAA